MQQQGRDSPGRQPRVQQVALQSEFMLNKLADTACTQQSCLSEFRKFWVMEMVVGVNCCASPLPFFPVAVKGEHATSVAQSNTIREPFIAAITAGIWPLLQEECAWVRCSCLWKSDAYTP